MSEQPSVNQHSVNPADRVKVAHLVVGLVFLGIVAIWALKATDVIGSIGLGVTLPLVLVIAGVVGLVAMVAGRRPTIPQSVPDISTDDTHLEETR